MNIKLKIKNLCKKYGAEKIAYYLAEYFIANWREIDDFKKYIEKREKEEKDWEIFNKSEDGKLLRKNKL